MTILLNRRLISHMHRLNTKLFFSVLILFLTNSGCSVFENQPDSADKILEKASQQRIFLAPYDTVWRAAHTTLKYTVATENQDFGVIETDYIKSVDGWISPD